MLCWQFNISEPWFAWENDVIGFANLADVGLVEYNTNDVTDENSTRWAPADQTSGLLPQLWDVISFNDSSDSLFSVAVLIDQSTFLLYLSSIMILIVTHLLMIVFERVDNYCIIEF